MSAQKDAGMTEFLCDFHVHSPASPDYKQDGVTPWMLLKRAKDVGLNAIALTDHSTIAGYEQLVRDLRKKTDFIQQAQALGDLVNADRLEQEIVDLAAAERLVFGPDLLVLPGIELCVEGVHVLGLFDPGGTLEEAERIVEVLKSTLVYPLRLPDLEDSESSNVVGKIIPDVLSLITAAPLCGIAVMAHVMSDHGFHRVLETVSKANRSAYFNTGLISAMEVKGAFHHREMSQYYGGTTPGYEQYADVIMGSDSHFLSAAECTRGASSGDVELGEIVTRFYLRELTFAEIRLALSPPHLKQGRYVRPGRADIDSLIEVSRYGVVRNVDFLDELPADNGDEMAMRLAHLVCSFANSTDGSIYVGVRPTKQGEEPGIEHLAGVNITLLPEEARESDTALTDWFQRFLADTVDPSDIPFAAQLMHVDKNTTVLAIEILKSLNPPYVALSDGAVYVRDDAGARPAISQDIRNIIGDSVRKTVEDQIMDTFREDLDRLRAALADATEGREALEQRLQDTQSRALQAQQRLAEVEQQLADAKAPEPPPVIPRPTTGVEIVEWSFDATRYRDLRSGQMGMRRNDEVDGTWRFALEKYERMMEQPEGWVPPEAAEDPEIPGLHVTKTGDWVDIYDLTNPDVDKHRYYFSCRAGDLGDFWQEVLDRCGYR